MPVDRFVSPETSSPAILFTGGDAAAESPARQLQDTLAHAFCEPPPQRWPGPARVAFLAVASAGFWSLIIFTFQAVSELHG